MDRETIIRVEELTKVFGSVRAVDGLSFHAVKGETVGLLGPNGAGKTTTIQLLLGLISPTSGSIRILGLDIGKHRLEILKRVNFSSAEIRMPSNLTALENLTTFAKLYGLRKPRPKILNLLDLFEIPGVLKRKTGALSSGQATRLNLCKAFLNDPEILFLDEPTASLDPDIADKVRRILAQVQQERELTILYTSHNMTEVEQMCDRVVFLKEGRIVTQGTPEEIIAETSSSTLEEVFLNVARNRAPAAKPTGGE